MDELELLRKLHGQQVKVCNAALYWAYRHGLTEPPGMSWRRLDERDLDAELLAAVREMYQPGTKPCD